MPFRIDHVDARVASLAAVERFYTDLLGALGATERSYVRVELSSWTRVRASDRYNAVEFSMPTATAGEPSGPQPFFGVIEEAAAPASRSRIAFAADSREDVARIASLLATMGARSVERSDEMEGPTYDAVFFEDPLGNRLEVVCRGSTPTSQV